MNKKLLLIINVAFLLLSCSSKEINNESLDLSESTTKIEIQESIDALKENNDNVLVQDDTTETKETNIKKSVNSYDNRASFAFDTTNKFKYTGDELYLKEITEAMVKELGSHFDEEKCVEIPTPYIVRVDDVDKEDIKIFADFYIYGYTMNGMIFDCENGGSFPGCLHLKEDNGEIKFVSFDIAEDGAGYIDSLMKICDGNESLMKDIENARIEDGDNLRIEYAKMYAKENNLRLCGIKDYGWPVILFNDIDDADFVFNFYDQYFNENYIEDTLNDLEERLNSFKNKYISKKLLAEIDELSNENDILLGSKEINDTMLDTLKVDDMGDGNVIVQFDLDNDTTYKVNIKVETIDNKKKIINILL